MPYVSTFDRTQMVMCSWDSFVEPESIARLIDADAKKNKSGFAVAQRRCWSGPRKGILSGIQRKIWCTVQENF